MFYGKKTFYYVNRVECSHIFWFHPNQFRKVATDKILDLQEVCNGHNLDQEVRISREDTKKKKLQGM